MTSRTLSEQLYMSSPPPRTIWEACVGASKCSLAGVESSRVRSSGQGWPTWTTPQSRLSAGINSVPRSVQDIHIAVVTIAESYLGRGASILRRVAFSGQKLFRSRPGPPFGPLLPPCREMSVRRPPEPVIFWTTRRLLPRLFPRPLSTPCSPLFLAARYSYTMSFVNASTSLKVLFIGDPKVGISSFLTVLRGKPFPNLYIPTHADIVDLHAMVPHRSPAEDSKAWGDWPNNSSTRPEPTADSDSPATKSTIQLLDITTYGEIYRWSREAAYRGANVVVLCFSVARRESFESLRTKVRQLRLLE